MSPIKSRYHLSKRLQQPCRKGAEALSLSHLGQQRLFGSDDPAGLILLDQALELDPDNGQLLFEQGLCLLEYGERERDRLYIRRAVRRLHSATQLCPAHFRAHYLLGYALHLLLEEHPDAQLLGRAKCSYERAAGLLEGQPVEWVGDFYAHWADLKRLEAHRSQELSDFHVARREYRRAADHAQTHTLALPPLFWNNCGEVSLWIGKENQSISDLDQSVTAFQRGLQTGTQPSDLGRLYLNLAAAFKLLYLQRGEELDFKQASYCFDQAAVADPDSVEPLSEQAQLFLDRGRAEQEPRWLQLATERAARVSAQSTAAASGLWGEALALLGLYQDRLEWIYEGKNRAHDYLTQTNGTPKAFLHLGNILITLGHYFQDSDLFNQAIEQFQEGLSIDRSCSFLWRAMGAGYLEVGLLDQEARSFEHAQRFCHKALMLEPSALHHHDYGYVLYQLNQFDNTYETLDQAVNHLKHALRGIHKPSHSRPRWLFDLACALAAQAEDQGKSSIHREAIQLFSALLPFTQEYPFPLHHQLALSYSQYANLTVERSAFSQALSYYAIAHKKNPEDGTILLDWAIALISFSEHQSQQEGTSLLEEAEEKLKEGCRLGEVEIYYTYACLLAMTKREREALAMLEKAALYESLPPVEEIVEDDWISDLQENPEFTRFLRKNRS